MSNIDRKRYRVRDIELEAASPEELLDNLASTVIKNAMEDVKTFFKLKLLTDKQVKKLAPASRYRYLEVVHGAAQSIGWIVSDDQPFGISLSFEECCNAQCINHEHLREKLLKFVKQGPKAHLLYLRDHSEELLGV